MLLFQLNIHECTHLCKFEGLASDIKYYCTDAVFERSSRKLQATPHKYSARSLYLCDFQAVDDKWKLKQPWNVSSKKCINVQRYLCKSSLLPFSHCHPDRVSVSDIVDKLRNFELRHTIRRHYYSYISAVTITRQHECSQCGINSDHS